MITSFDEVSLDQKGWCSVCVLPVDEGREGIRLF